MMDYKDLLEHLLVHLSDLISCVSSPRLLYFSGTDLLLFIKSTRPTFSLEPW